MSSACLTAELVQSLFCGLPNHGARMAVILSASDETYRGRFMYAGFLAPVKYWYGIFSRDWEKKVLGSNPKLDFLHMTEIKSPAWRAKAGISEEEAERRIDNAMDILCNRKEPMWLSFDFDFEIFNRDLKRKMKIDSGAIKILTAEYFGFIGYVMTILKFVREAYPDVDKVDFMIEQNGEVTKHLPEFYEAIPRFLKSVGDEDKLKLLGQIIPGDKYRAPLQAADLVCWHLRRGIEKTLREEDKPRYLRIREKRNLIGWIDDDALKNFKTALDKFDEEERANGQL